MSYDAPGVGKHLPVLRITQCRGQWRIVARLQRHFFSHHQAEKIRLCQDLDVYEGTTGLQGDAREDLAAQKSKRAGDIKIAQTEKNARQQGRRMALPAEPTG